MQTFTAAVSNDNANAGVTWAATAGFITAAGVYMAPSTMMADSATVTATSKTDATKSATAIVTLVSAALSVAPSNPVAMNGGATQAFTATITGDTTNSGVTWTATGGGSFSPTKTLSGVATTYTAADPVAAPSAVVTATSVTYPLLSASVTVPLVPIAVSLTSAKSATLDGDGVQTLAIKASVTGDLSSSGATFTVGGGGTVSASPAPGNTPSSTYTAPKVTSASSAIVTVASVKDPGRSQAVAVTINPPMMFTTASSLPAGVTGLPYSSTALVVTGGTGSKTFAVTSGSLPAGITLSGEGVLSGTPSGSPGTSTFTVSATDQASTPAVVSATFTLSLGIPQIVSASPSSITVGSPDTTVTLTGVGFDASSVISINNFPQPTTFLSATMLSVKIPSYFVSTSPNLLYLSVRTRNYASNSFSISLVNPVPVLTSISPSAVIAGSSNLLLTVTGMGFLNGSTVEVNGVSHILFGTSPTSAQVSVTAQEVASVGSLSVTVVNPTPGGGSSNALLLQVIGAADRVRTLAYYATDVATDPVRNLIYASIGSSSATSPNSLIAIDPVQGTAVTTVAVTGQPNRIAITDDGSYLYVSFRDTAEVRRYILPELTSDIQWTVGGKGAVDLETAPGKPHTVAVTTSALGAYVQNVMVYDDGVARASTVSGSYPAPSYDTIAWGSDASTLYGTGSVTSGGPEYVLNVDQNGPTLAATYSSAFGDFVNHLQFDKKTDLLFDGYGRAVNPATGSLVGQFNVRNTLSYEQNPFTVNPGNGRAFFLNASNFSIPSLPGDEIQAFDLSTYAYVNSLVVPGLSGSRVVSWGASGLAVGGGNQIYIIDGPFVTPGAVPSPIGGYAAPSPTLTALSVESVRMGSVSVDVVVTGKDFTQAALATWDRQTLSSTWQSPTQITVTFPASLLLQAVASGLTVANGPNAESSNTLTFSVLPNLGANAEISVLNLSGEDMVWDAARNLLYVAVTSSEAQNGNTIAIVDPTAPALRSTVFTGSQPSVLGISDDSHFLYTGFQTSASVQRFILPDFTPDLTIPLNSGIANENFAVDIKVAPGQNQTIAVSMGNKDIEPRDAGGLAVFDKAIQRPNVRSRSFGDTFKVAWGKDATRLYANSDPGETPQSSSVLSVDATGFTGFVGGFRGGDIGLRPHFDPVTNLVYSDGGRVSNPADGTTAGVLGSYGLMVPDAALNRAFFLRPNGTTETYSLDIFDLRRQTMLKSITIGGVIGNPTQLVRWGTQGLAFLTEDQNSGTGGLYLVQGSDISGLTTPPAGAITLSPSHVPVGMASGTIVTVSGTNFLPTATVQVNGQNRPATYLSGTQLSFMLTAADQISATYLDVRVTNSADAGTTTPPSTLEVDNPVPMIASTAPSAVLVGAGDTLVTLTGTGFVPSTTVKLNTIPLTTTYISPTSISVVLPFSDFTAAGSLALTAVSPEPGGGASAVANLPVDYPVPVITSIAPNAFETGSAAQMVYVYGNGFVPGAVVQVGGAPRVTTFVYSSTLSFSLTSADLASAVSLSIVVVNPAPGGGSSAAASVVVNNAQLGPITLSPNSVVTGATPPATITVTGSNFLTGAIVQVNGSTRTSKYISSTQLTFELTTADQATARTLYVVVSNPSPGGGSAYANLTVASSTLTPVISSVSPTQFVRGSIGNYLQVAGMGFTAGSTVLWNGSALSGASLQYDGSLIVAVSDTLVASSGSASITVSTPNSSSSLSNSTSASIVDPAAPTLTGMNPNVGSFHTATVVTLSGANFTHDTVLTLNGSALPFPLASSGQITVTIPAERLLPGNNIFSLTTPAPGGGTSGSQTFTAYVPVANNDMVYSPSSALFYLSVPSSAGAPYGNSIVSLDPATGALGTPIFVGSEPDHMALTSDGRSLWVGLDGADSVRKVDLVANTAGLIFPLSTANATAPKSAALVAVPGQPDSVVVSALDQASNSSTTTLTVYDSGVPRATSISTASSPLAISLQIDGTRGEVYAGASGEYRVFSYDASGITLKTHVHPSTNLANNPLDRVQLDSGRIYTDYSTVFDAETGASLGAFPYAAQNNTFAPIAIDSASGLAFLLNSSQQYAEVPNRIQLARMSDFTATGTAIPVNIAANAYGAISQATTLLRWGSNGLAFRTGIAVYPLRSDLVKDLSSSPAHLGVTIASTGSAITGAAQTYTATITNAGPTSASEVVATVLIPSTGVLMTVTPSSGTCSTGTVTSCSLGTLGSGASASITVAVRQLSPGASTLSVQVGASQADPNPADNQATSTITFTGSTYAPAPSLLAVSPTSILSGSPDTVVTVTGQNFGDGTNLLIDGVALPAVIASATELTATIPAASLATLGWHQLAVQNATPGGGTSSAATLSVFSVIHAGANHIIYEPYSRRIYATLGSTMPLGNSVEAIDPVTGAVSTPVFIGSEPTRMALSDDGQTLYTVASQANTVVRLNTLSQTTDASFGLQASVFQTNDSSSADLAVQPGSENTIVVNQLGAQIVDFDPVGHTSVARPQTLTGGLISPHFLDAGNAIGYGSGAFSRYAVSSTGLGGAALSQFVGDASPFKLAQGLAFTNSGNVVDVTSQPNRMAGSFFVSRAFYGSSSLFLAPEPAIGRAFFLLGYDGVSNFNIGVPTGLVAFDTRTFLQAAYVPLAIAAIEPQTDNPVAAVDVIRWGQDGVAALTSSGNIYLVRGPAVLPQLLETGIPPALLDNIPSGLTHGSGNTLLTLSGSNFVPGIAVTWNGSYRTTTLVDGMHVKVDVSAADLAVSGTVSLVATNPGAGTSSAITVTIH